MAGTGAADDLPEDVLLEIFSRVPNVMNLFCCAMTCKRWLRLFADPGFLRRLWPADQVSSFLLGLFYQRENFSPNKKWMTRESSSVAPPRFVPRSAFALGYHGGHLPLTDFIAGDHGLFSYATPLVSRRGLLLVQLARSRGLHVAVINPIAGMRHVVARLECSYVQHGYAIITNVQIEVTDQEYEKEKLKERVVKLSGGVAVIQVGAQTETELKEKKLRVEDALNATKAAVEEGIVVGGGCTLLRLASKVDAIIETLENDEQKVGAEIVRKSLSYPLKLIAKNADINGSVVTEKVLANDDFRYGYNAATGKYEDLMSAGIIDPTKAVRCCLEHAASVAKTFLTSDPVVVDIKEAEQAPAANPMAGSGYGF